MTELPTLAQIEAATHTIYAAFGATPQYCWPMLSQRLGTACWVKHENHTPVGAFKVRGGLTYFEHLRSTGQLPQTVISATRGNHGQSLAFAGRQHGVPVTILVPQGNSTEKNAAMRAFGAELIEHGEFNRLHCADQAYPNHKQRNRWGSDRNPAPFPDDVFKNTFHLICDRH
jgi:threonine dehydratase